MVLMHLGLIYMPFVPHNPVSTKQSPVPLPKFQMAPRLKISMPSGSKKGTQIYFFFYFVSSGKQTPTRFLSTGSLGERYPFTGHVYTS
jgi:hypothetical protein